jgi:mannosyl-oligosaccharide glucosidase
MSRDAIAHWLDLLNSKGWIPRCGCQPLLHTRSLRSSSPGVCQQLFVSGSCRPTKRAARLPCREQILGSEAASRVPPEFIVQDPSAANPPSLLLVLLKMARSLSRSEGGAEGEREAELVRAFLERAWPRLEAWFDWYNTTQVREQAMH